MGLFDYVYCEYPLPGKYPECAKGAAFQTKDLTCYMKEYTITSEGRLIDNSGQEDHGNITATIDLVWSNVVASGPGIYTRDGEDAHYLEYRVMFASGSLVYATEVRNESHRAAKYKPDPPRERSEEELGLIAERRSASLIGKTMWLQYGGYYDPGCEVKVIAENAKCWVVEDHDEKVSVIDRGSRDLTLCDSSEDARRFNKDRKRDWEKQRMEYEAEIQKPTVSISKRGDPAQ